MSFHVVTDDEGREPLAQAENDGQQELPLALDDSFTARAMGPLSDCDTKPAFLDVLQRCRSC